MSFNGGYNSGKLVANLTSTLHILYSPCRPHDDCLFLRLKPLTMAPFPFGAVAGGGKVIKCGMMVAHVF